MKNKIIRTDRLLLAFVATLALFAAPQASAQTASNLATWSFQDTVAPTTNATDITLSDFSVSSGSISYQDGNGGRIAYATSWSQSPTFSTGGKYWQFTLTPDEGYLASLTEISFLTGRTASGPARLTLQYSLDGFATAETTLLSGGNNASTSTSSLTAFSITSGLPVDVSGAITFRLWGYNASGTGNFRIDDVEIFGTVSADGPAGSDLYWTANGSTLGGTGTWATSGNNWSADASPVSGAVWDGTKKAIFTNSPAEVTVSTVTASAGIQFATDGYTLSSGTLTLGGPNAAANTITTDTSVGASINSILAGTAGLTKAGNGTLTLGGANTYTGGTLVSGGVLALTNGSALADTAAVTLANTAGVVLEADQNETIGSLAGGGATGGSVALDTNTLTLNQSGNTTYTGAINGTGILAKSGSGTLTFNQAGAIGTDFDMVINGGTIDFNRAGSAIGVLLGTGNTIQLNGGTVGFTSSSAANGAITNGGIFVTADSTILIARTASQSHSTTITAPLSFSNNANLTFAYNANVTAGTTTFAGANNTLNSDATITLTNYAVTISGPIGEAGGSRALAKAGAGTLILAGANTYTGKTTLNSGTLVLSGSGTAGATNSDLDVTGGLLNLSGGAKTNAAFTLSGGTITNGTLQATSYALQGGTIISNATLGTGTATVTTGTTTLNGLLNAATLNVNSGTLTAGSSGRFTGTPTVTVSNGATLNLAGNETFGSLAGAGSVSNSAGRITAGGNNSSTTFGGVLSGAGELTKTGIGRLSLSGSSSYNGATTVSAGELNLSGGSISNSAVTVASGASLSGYGSVGTIGGAGAINPGNSPGILTTPEVNPSAGTTFNFEMTGTAPIYSNAASSVNDVIQITSATQFSQALTASNGINIYFSGDALFTGSPKTITGGFFTGQSTNLASSISGAMFNYYFADTNGAGYYNKAQYESLVLGTNMLITVSTVAQTANFGGGDINGQVMQVQVIPEPSTYALLGLSAAAFGAYRWRRRRRG